MSKNIPHNDVCSQLDSEHYKSTMSILSPSLLYIEKKGQWIALVEHKDASDSFEVTSNHLNQSIFHSWSDKTCAVKQNRHIVK